VGAVSQCALDLGAPLQQPVELRVAGRDRRRVGADLRHDLRQFEQETAPLLVGRALISRIGAPCNQAAIASTVWP
jgi:hypothetical protein